MCHLSSGVFLFPQTKPCLNESKNKSSNCGVLAVGEPYWEGALLKWYHVLGPFCSQTLCQPSISRVLLWQTPLPLRALTFTASPSELGDVQLCFCLLILHEAKYVFFSMENRLDKNKTDISPVQRGKVLLSLGQKWPQCPGCYSK